MNRNKCPGCGLVNAEADQTCRRCGAALLENEFDDSSAEASPQSAADFDEAKPKRTILRRLVWILGTTLILLFVWFLSLLASSERLGPERRKTVADAVAILDQNGFGREAWVLRNLVTYRQTDNWWNGYVGHHEAYAATNFPFEIVTLYPQFFEKTIDDNERAAILLHEACHLFGSGEESALEQTWRNKQRLGWTAEKYGRTSEAWNHTRQLTLTSAPQLFKCGPDGQSDCF